MPSIPGTANNTSQGSPDPDEAYLIRILVRLKKEREARGMTLRDLEKLMGVSNAHLSRAERGLTEAGIVVLRRWCRALDLKFEDVCRDAAED